jgi:hypothetical protein
MVPLALINGLPCTVTYLPTFTQLRKYIFADSNRRNIDSILPTVNIHIPKPDDRGFSLLIS